MIDAPTQAVLVDIVRRESRSLLHYVSEAFPWTAPEELAALEQMQKLIQEEQHAIGNLVRFLQRHHVPPPPLGTYPMSFTNINFVSLDHLLPVLVNYQRQAIQALEKDLARISDPAARESVQALLTIKRSHMQSLEKLAANIPQPALT